MEFLKSLFNRLTSHSVSKCGTVFCMLNHAEQKCGGLLLSEVNYKIKKETFCCFMLSSGQWYKHRNACFVFCLTGQVFRVIPGYISQQVSKGDVAARFLHAGYFLFVAQPSQSQCQTFYGITDS